MFIFLCIIAGYLYATWLEWVLHKYILHGLGKKKNSWFSFHWSDHHNTCRKNDNKDEAYNTFLPTAVSREILGLYALLIFHLPLYFIAPWFYYILIASAARYFYVHQKSHRDVEWGKKNVPWHYEHHMGKNQEANWGVTTPLWDYILGTKSKEYQN